MKKSLIALAVLAASGAAMAQSSVTLYGRVDAYVGTLKDTLTSTTTASNPSQTVLNSGGISTSMWGLKGTEDLGGGLKANFQLEQQITLDTGAAADFSRHAWVGLSGGFGEVLLGKTYNAYHSFRASVNNTGDLNMSPTGDVWKVGGSQRDYTNNFNNQIRYNSPTFGGVSAAVSYSFGEDKTTTASANDKFGLNVKYANGPLVVGYAYQSEDTQTTVARDVKYNFVGGSYDFGVAKVVAGYNTTKRVIVTGAVEEKDKEYQLGVQAPFGPVNVYVGYAAAKVENAAGATVAKASGYALVGTYDMSKRTTLYAGYKSVTEKVIAGAGEKKQLSVGVRHTF